MRVVLKFKYILSGFANMPVGTNKYKYLLEYDRIMIKVWMWLVEMCLGFGRDKVDERMPLKAFYFNRNLTRLKVSEKLFQINGKTFICIVSYFIEYIHNDIDK